MKKYFAVCLWYDKTIEADLKQNAVMTAAFAWMAANRLALIPRK